MGSLWGSACVCPNCDFFFSSDHAHGSYRAEPPMAGYCHTVCGACAGTFMLPTRGARGPHDGERMELCVASDEQDRMLLQGTGTYLEYYELAQAATWSDRFTLASTACPACGASGSLKMEFNDGDTCPGCKQARLRCR